MFLDQRLALLLKSLMDHCVDGASFLGAKASTLWRQVVRGWFIMWGRPVPYAYEKALDTQELDRKYALVLSHTPEQIEPENIPAGTVMESKVRALTHTHTHVHIPCSHTPLHTHSSWAFAKAELMNGYMQVVIREPFIKFCFPNTFSMCVCVRVCVSPRETVCVLRAGRCVICV